jgi:dTDP-glucose 4,6-dehydratase
LNPGNPYSATKAAVDMLALSYFNTYKIPVIILRLENNYGAFQHRQKAIPNWINKALKDEYLVVYGDGQHERMWLRVEDCCKAIQRVIEKGIVGEIYNIGGRQKESNINMAKRILKTLNKPDNLIRFIPDEIARPGHDRRYGIDTTKINNLGWESNKTLDDLDEVINWYKENPWWFK